MKIKSITGALIIGLLLFGSKLNHGGIGDIEILNSPYLTTVPSDGASQGEVKISAFVTGWVKAPANILIDQKHIQLPEALKSDLWVPSIAYAVRHPQHGTVILDLGLSPGDCEFGIRPIYSVPCVNAPGSDLASQLAADGPHDVKYIIPSHFHGDHISGLENFLSHHNAPLIMTQVALEEMRSPLRILRGIESRMLKANMQILIADKYLNDDTLLGPTIDIFRDKSLLIFATPGHTDGHISALINTADEKILLTFDAAHLKANFDLRIPSGALASKDDAENSFKTLRKISASNNVTRIIFGHEPSQWCRSATAPQDVRRACEL